MKLSALVRYLNYLNQITPLNVESILHDNLAHVLHAVKSRDIQILNLSADLEQNYQDVQKTLNFFNQTIDQLKSQIKKNIAVLETDYYIASSELYINELIHDNQDCILNRNVDLSTEMHDFIIARVSPNSDWHYPGLIIRPGIDEWINHLVGCDPLYLVDQSQALLDACVGRFNVHYQKRLRPYVIDESIKGGMMDRLPDEQFSYCLVYNFFNFKPIEIISLYLSEIYNKLKPGGSLAMTFNDCDHEGAVELVERRFACYTPGSVVVSVLEKIGFELTIKYQLNAACTWLELHKPGQLSSIRSGQTLAKIKPKPLEEVLDFRPESSYTSNEIDQIEMRALTLGVVTTDNFKNYTPHQLLTLIKQRKQK